MIVPDYVQEIEAWRVWRVVQDIDGYRLRSVHFDTVWQPRVPLRATCMHRRRSLRHPVRGLPPAHAAPLLECCCGIHAFPAAHHAAAYLRTCGAYFGAAALYAAGPVALWGDVAQHTDGWRAGFAYPQAIHVRPSGRWVGEQLMAVTASLVDYDVPVRVLEPHPTDEPLLDTWTAQAREARFPTIGR